MSFTLLCRSMPPRRCIVRLQPMPPSPGPFAAALPLHRSPVPPAPHSAARACTATPTAKPGGASAAPPPPTPPAGPRCACAMPTRSSMPASSQPAPQVGTAQTSSHETSGVLCAHRHGTAGAVLHADNRMGFASTHIKQHGLTNTMIASQPLAWRSCRRPAATALRAVPGVCSVQPSKCWTSASQAHRFFSALLCLQPR